MRAVAFLCFHLEVETFYRPTRMTSGISSWNEAQTHWCKDSATMMVVSPLELDFMTKQGVKAGQVSSCSPGCTRRHLFGEKHKK